LSKSSGNIYKDNGLSLGMPRIAVINKERCNPHGCGGFLCMRLCPVNMTDKECIVKHEGKVKIDALLCTGCGICPNRCPFDAIAIVNLPDELAKQPIHRYGQNGFHLYNLPMPLFGKVVGIIGRNGVGKSTAIKILAGVLQPNLGREEEVLQEEILQFFKGTEAQNFFEKVMRREIKVAYKPQQVELIPKNAKGKVKDLLKKVDERKKFGEIVEALDLLHVLDTDIKNISGGELQRVAIAATVLRKANLYIFDEPTSYLDIKQRLKVAKFIKNLADENTAVLVVEHDLIILDYMTDMIHILYGQEGVYGIVSHPRQSRAGINTYLSGYLKDENMRFRPYGIRFEEKPPIINKQRVDITSWDNVQKKLGRFSLHAVKGSLAKNRVVGVLGENGIGKTSFIKVLAHVTKPDSGKLREQVTVSYKPQYLEADSDELVISVLADAVHKYKAALIDPLEIKPLLMKKLNQLSGGELQRVSIALALSQNADVYLLDEPSAYLDVEQRLKISKVIRDLAEKRSASILVVDHDLLFIDYLSEELMVFEGVPAKKGNVKGPFSMSEGMNLFLKELDLTFRRDPITRRPRANKQGSRLDREQKEKGMLYYS
jgi:ATP-binding cassette, sub-family E, member 1